MRPTIEEILEECRREHDAERALELARIGEHVCRPRRVARLTDESIVCETCGERMRETSVLEQVTRRRL